jgi:hypothetical protein
MDGRPSYLDQVVPDPADLTDDELNHVLQACELVALRAEHAGLMIPTLHLRSAIQKLIDAITEEP